VTKAQAVSRRFFTADVRFRSQVSPFWVFRRRKWHWDRGFLRVVRFSCVSSIPVLYRLSDGHTSGLIAVTVQRDTVSPSHLLFDVVSLNRPGSNRRSFRESETSTWWAAACSARPGTSHLLHAACLAEERNKSLQVSRTDSAHRSILNYKTDCGRLATRTETEKQRTLDKGH
jgi:hypothetical protein